MKRALGLAACAGAALIALPATAREVFGARGAMAAVTGGTLPDSISGVLGQRNTLALQLNLGATGKLLGSYTITIQWDSTIVRLDSVGAGVYSTPLVNYVSGGEVRLTSAVASGLGGTFTLGQLYFRFVNDTVGKRTVIQPTFTELTATDFSNLLVDFATTATAARILPPSVIVRFTPDSVRERVGYKPQIDLTTDLSQAAGVNLGSYTASFTWDPSIMLLDSLKAGDFVAPQVNQTSPGQLYLTAADAQGRGGPAFSLARLYFRYVNTSYPVETALTLTVSEMHAALTFADLLPGVSARNGKALIGGVLRGDIDIGGTITALDAQVILQGVVGLALPPGAVGVPNGDADCNASLQAKDAQIVLNLVVGNTSPFCGGKIQ